MARRKEPKPTICGDCQADFGLNVILCPKHTATDDLLAFALAVETEDAGAWAAMQRRPLNAEMRALLDKALKSAKAGGHAERAT